MYLTVKKAADKTAFLLALDEMSFYRIVNVSSKRNYGGEKIVELIQIRLQNPLSHSREDLFCKI